MIEQEQCRRLLRQDIGNCNLPDIIVRLKPQKRILSHFEAAP
jgi:hypothetical protein